MVEQRVNTRAESVKRGVFIDDADLQIRVTQVVINETFRIAGVLDGQEVAPVKGNAEAALNAVGKDHTPPPAPAVEFDQRISY